jgi:atypical dual specificity phosphatase
MNRETLHRLYAKSVFHPTLAWNYTLARVFRVRNWWDHIDEYVIVGAYPFAMDVARMRAAGVRAVVNTCEEYAGPTNAYLKHEIDQLWIPTTDFTHPRLEDLERAVEFVQKHSEAKQTVYIHCKAGRARSATVAICWLIKHRSLSVEEAQLKLLVARPHINRRLAQRPVVVEFAKKHGIDAV